MKTFKLLGVGIIYTVIITISSAYAEEYRIGDLTIKDEKSHRSFTFSKKQIESLETHIQDCERLKSLCDN